MKSEANGLEARLDYTFKRKRLLEEALRHSSIKDEEHPSNERLEFLGDAVLGLIATEYIFRRYGELNEGEMTAIKSALVSSASLLKIARTLRLKSHIHVGRGISKNRTIPDSLVANAVEAVLGAIYLDSGYRAARKFVLAYLEPMLVKTLKAKAAPNYKSLLQNYVQKKFGSTPHYLLLREDGPDHDKLFELSAVVGDRTFPPGAGKSKKIASQNAARFALKMLQDEYGKLSDPTH